MAEQITWTTSVKVQNGPTFSVGSTLNTEVYEKFQVTIKAPEGGAAATEEAVTVLPAGVAGEFLLIKASSYVGEDSENEKLVYDAGGGDTDLTGPIVLTDSTAVGLLGANLATITFKNSIPMDVTVEILVARAAGPAA